MTPKQYAYAIARLAWSRDCDPTVIAGIERGRYCTPAMFGEGEWWSVCLYVDAPAVPGRVDIVPVSLLVWPETERLLHAGAAFRLTFGRHHVADGEVLELRDASEEEFRSLWHGEARKQT
jgi:hypothetical protein